MGTVSSKSKHGKSPIPKQKQKIHTIYKITLFGAGDSGKSTIFKAVMNIHKEFITNQPNLCDIRDDTASIYVIRQNCVASILCLLGKTQEIYDQDPGKYSKCLVHMNDQISSDVRFLVNYGNESFEDVLNINYNELQELGNAIYRLWKLKAVQETWKLCRRGKFCFPNNMDYFLDKIKLIMSEKYRQSKEDHFKARQRTTGINTFLYEIDSGKTFNLFDVGGLRGERKKWIHSFESVSCLIFVCGLDHFCKVLFEDEWKNALQEDLELFQWLAQCKWFKHRYCKMVVILNKTDLFYECLKYNSLKFCFGDNYNGQVNTQHYDLNIMKRIMKLVLDDIDIVLPMDIMRIVMTYYEDLYKLDLAYLDGISYIRNIFLQMRPDAIIYELCATKIEQVNKIMQDIQQQVIDSRSLFCL